MIMAIHIPSTGAWYQDTAINQLFEIIAIDDTSATIDIRYEGGEITDIDLNDWAQMSLIRVNAPDDSGDSMNLSIHERFFSDSIISLGIEADSLTDLGLDAAFDWDDGN
tara:strand:- start:951 stop:1277 length:327 start_codon:yes stop_codon:yes gene_type:complete